MTYLKRLTWLVFLAWGGNAMAALAITSEVIIEPHPSVLLRGQQATVTYILTNTGDEPLELASAGFVYRTFGPLSTLFPFPTEATLPCGFHLLDFSTLPGVPGFVGNTNTFLPWPIEPGESRRCVTGLQVSAQTAGPFVQRFAFSGSRGDRSVSAPQHVTFTLGEQPMMIPTVSWGSLILAGMLILLLGVNRLPR